MRNFFLALFTSSLFASADNPYGPVFDQRNINEQLNQAEQLLLKAESPDLMTGDWGGGRSYLLEHGVRFDLSFQTDMVGNPIGGQARGFAYAGSFGFAMDVDFGKACGWTGFEFYSSVVWRTGTSLSQRKIDNQFPVQQVFGSQNVKLNELYLAQTLFDNTFFIKAGRLDAGNDFLASPLYGQFVNNAFNGNPISPFFNFPSFTAYPNATWGAYIRGNPLAQLSMKFAVYNANSNIFANKYHGINFTFTSTNGVIWITEWAALINQEKDATGLPGNYKVGFFYQTGDVAAFKNGSVRGDGCLYFLFDQMIYRKAGTSDQGLTPFIALLFAPQNRNEFPFFCTAGLVYKGILPNRPQDTASLGVAYGSYSADLAAVEREAKKTGILGNYGNRPQSFEAILELNYWVQVNGWFMFTPDVQYVINPSGYGSIQNALVLGAQITVIL